MQVARSAGEVAQHSGLIARLFEESQGPACVVDAGLAIVYVNQAWIKLCGDGTGLEDCLLRVGGNHPEWIRRASREQGFLVERCELHKPPGASCGLVCIPEFVRDLDLVLLVAFEATGTRGPAFESSLRGQAGPIRERGTAVSRLVLTPREVEIVTLLAKGLSGARVAAHLVISEATVQAHVRNAMKKTGTANRTALVAYAMAEGLVKA